MQWLFEAFYNNVINGINGIWLSQRTNVGHPLTLICYGEGCGMENAAESHLELLPNGSRLHVTICQPVNMTKSYAEAADNNFLFSILAGRCLILCHIYVRGVS